MDRPRIRTVRIFVSSPYDVDFERQRVDRVAEQLNHAFADLVEFKTIRWERKLYSSHAGFQDQIPEAAGCDLVIAVFWSRLGTPLPDSFSRMENGERYPSGSAYEVLSALEARKRGERPDVYVFRKTEPSPDNSDDAKGQWRDLNAFFSRWFQTPDGQFLRAYHRFATTDEFGAQVKTLLQDWVKEHNPRNNALIWPIETKGSPFRALLPFDAKHADIYFGRERKVTRAIEQLQSVGRALRGARAGPRSVPFLLIVGESGAGKSSLMRAGLAPRLTAPGVVPGVDHWRTAIVRVGDDPNPFLTLAKSLLVIDDDDRGFGTALPELCDHGFQTPDSLADLLAAGAKIGERKKRCPASIPIVQSLAQVQAKEKTRGGFKRRVRANLLLLVDQLENIFAADIGDEERSAFARLLFALCATRRVWIVATVRSDIYPRIITPGDFLALKDAGGVYDLATPGESELTEIVRKSAAAAGLIYETNADTGERLDERILKDAHGKNTLPLLQFALDRLFKDREIVDGEVRLTFAAYEAMHGLDGAIHQAAETALARLGQTEIDALPRLLRCLAVPVHDRKSATNVGNDLTVRTVPKAQAIYDEPTGRLVNELIDARIIVTTGSGNQSTGDDAGVIGVSHQRVFESWERARTIVAEHKDFFRIRDEVEAQRRRWQEKGRPAALLLAKGVPLAEAQKIVKDYGEELDQDVRAYVTTSNRRAQRLNIFMSATAAVFATLFLAATVLWFVAQRAQQTATTNYEAAKGAVSDLVSVITRSLQNIQGIRVATVQEILGIVDKTIQKVQSASSDDPQLALIRAEMLFQGGKALQKKEDLPHALEAARESLAIRAKLTGFVQWKSAPSVFAAAPGIWRWKLSESLEFVGDLLRQDRKYPDAHTYFEDTLAIRIRLVAEAPDNEDWAQGVSQIHTRLGDLAIFSDLTAALRSYQFSLAIAAKFFHRKTTDDRWQRELSWSYNKIGDVKARSGDVKAKTGDLGAKKSEYSAALEAFDNSLCLRRQISARAPSNTELRRDIPFSLDRIGNVKRQLDDLPGAEFAYFEALAVRRELANSVSDDARYLGDVAISLQLIGDYYLAKGDLKGAMAFYDAGVDVRRQVLRRALPEDQRAPQNLTNAQRKAEAARKQALEKQIPLEDFTDRWWLKPVADAEAAFDKRMAEFSIDPKACWDRVVASVDQIVTTTATIH
jgi:tetratricopeptide (TPR) repeat protein